MLRYHGLLAHVVQKETAGAVGIFSPSGSETALSDQGGRLVAEAAGDFHALEFRAGELPVRRLVARRDDLGEVEFGCLDVEFKEGDQFVVVLELVDVHEHGAGGVGGVGDEDVGVDTAVQLVHEPAIDGAKGECPGLVCLLDLVRVFQEPEQFRRRRVGG